MARPRTVASPSSTLAVRSVHDGFPGSGRDSLDGAFAHRMAPTTSLIARLSSAGGVGELPASVLDAANISTAALEIDLVRLLRPLRLTSRGGGVPLAGPPRLPPPAGVR